MAQPAKLFETPIPVDEADPKAQIEALKAQIRALKAREIKVESFVLQDGSPGVCVSGAIGKRVIKSRENMAKLFSEDAVAAVRAHLAKMAPQQA